jgi:hypothetical protein
MRITSILRTGTLALTLTAAFFAVSPVYAAPASTTQSQLHQSGDTGPYDNGDFQASARSET